jgi:hypothetical protein
MALSSRPATAPDEPKFDQIQGAWTDRHWQIDWLNLLGGDPDVSHQAQQDQANDVFPGRSRPLIIMAGTMKRFWKHEIPKTKEPVGERINLTNRQILEIES